MSGIDVFAVLEGPDEAMEAIEELIEASARLLRHCEADGWPRVADQMMPLAALRAALAKVQP